MLGRRFMKGQQRIAAFLMALVMIIGGVGIIPINADAEGRKIVKKLVVKQTSLKLEEGENEKVKYKVTATTGTNKKIVVKVSNKKVISAKVSGGKIVVRAKKEGKSTITVMTKAKNKRGKRIAKKIQVLVENENYDEDELDYDFEDNESYEEDETTENTANNPVTTEVRVTTENTSDNSITTEATITTKRKETLPTISYQAHVQEIGWMPNVKDGAEAGTTGKTKRLEGLKITLQDDKGNSMIKYRAHVEDTGWQGWRTSGQVAGTEEQSKRMEGIQIQLTGTYAEKYDIYYCVHVARFGWLGWAKNGETAGSEGLALQAEAIRIKLVKKNTAFSVGGRHVIVRPNLTYQAHCAYLGWKSAVSNEGLAGTIGEKRQLEGLKINLADTDGKSGIEYRAHVSDVGWQGWKNSGGIAGTTGESRKLEAVEIKLKGNLANDFDIYYRMHVADIGWLGWAKNGETAGTTGGARQAEAIEIKIVGRGASVDRGGAAYQKLTQITAGTAAEAVRIAASQIGYYEKASNYNLDDFTANKGNGNYTKYARDIGVTNGQDWCTTFMIWCMKQAGISSDVYPSSIPYNLRVDHMRDWFKAKGLFRTKGTYIPKAGDFIFFGSTGGTHVGMVEKVCNGKVYTIEGNTRGATMVDRHTEYSLSNSWVFGYGIVNYK